MADRTTYQNISLPPPSLPPPPRGQPFRVLFYPGATSSCDRNGISVYSVELFSHVQMSEGLFFVPRLRLLASLLPNAPVSLLDGLGRMKERQHLTARLGRARVY